MDDVRELAKLIYSSGYTDQLLDPPNDLYQESAYRAAEDLLVSDWLRARDERNWDAGHNQCFHVDPPKSAGNPHRLPPFASKDLTTRLD